MPTALPRYQVTETAEVARALDAAARRWPGEPRSKLLLRLVAAGAEQQAHEDAVERRRVAVQASSGRYDDAFPARHLAALREDWPA